VIDDIIFALWFLLPAAGANVAPVIAAHLPILQRWSAPIDGGRTFHGQAIFGPHKTWRGLASGIVLATLILWAQQAILGHADPFSPLNQYVEYATLPLLIVGPLFAVGALGGDALKSFFKRRKGIQSGKSWLFFDQLDYILGAILVTLPIVVLPLQIYLWMLLLWFLAHLLANYVGWLLKLRETPI
jgi:CDP-2,3-bis-(O-geranylgeranyl)-sn-glycerol synthase